MQETVQELMMYASLISHRVLTLALSHEQVEVGVAGGPAADDEDTKLTIKKRLMIALDEAWQEGSVQKVLVKICCFQFKDSFCLVAAWSQGGRIRKLRALSLRAIWKQPRKARSFCKGWWLHFLKLFSMM